MPRSRSHGPGQGASKHEFVRKPSRAFTAKDGKAAQAARREKLREETSAPEGTPLKELLRLRRERLEAEGLYIPKERTANAAEIREMARAAAPEVMRELIEIALNEPSAEARIKAADKVLERGYGKAAQPVDLSINPSEMTDEQLAAIASGGSHGAAGAAPDQD